MTHADFDSVAPADLVRRLVAAGRDPDPALRARIRDMGEPCVEPLIGILADRGLDDNNAPGGGWLPIHAARLLGEMRAVAAISPLLDALVHCDFQDVLFNDIMLALPRMGDALVEPALRAYARSDDPDYRDLMCALLAECGAKDERTWLLLGEQLQRSPDLGAMNLAEYADQRAVPLLLERLDAMRPGPDGACDDMAIVELCGALEEFGVGLTAAQQAVLKSAVAQRRACFLARMPAFAALEDDDNYLDEDLADVTEHPPQATHVREGPKVGRNQPCPCGSGKKYKKCHGANA